jgi:hypothetical protein
LSALTIRLRTFIWLQCIVSKAPDNLYGKDLPHYKRTQKSYKEDAKNTEVKPQNAKEPLHLSFYQ